MCGTLELEGATHPGGGPASGSHSSAPLSHLAQKTIFGDST